MRNRKITHLCHTEQDEVCHVINVFQSHVRPAQCDKIKILYEITKNFKK